ncbi:MAG: hypothetical protein GXY83_39860 [Rhodopirellula sp.]|nr:hypothetical protein [Rhodopirellula sp.]
MLWIHRVAVFVAVLATSCSSALAQGAATDPVPGGSTITIENASTRLVLSPDGGIQSLALHDGRELLAQADARLMLLRIAGRWHSSSSLAVSRDADDYRLLVGFDGIQVTAKAIIKPHPTYFEIRCEGLQGDGCKEVEQWTFANVPVNVRANVGTWLNIAWDDGVAVALTALDEKTNATGSPLLRATSLRKLGIEGGSAALIASPRTAILDIIQQVEKEHGLPCPTLGGQWAKKSPEARKSWMITGLTAAPEPAAFRAERVFQLAQSLGVQYVVISLNWWNTSLGSYGLNLKNFPEGVATLKGVADQAHARGLKLGIHVMTRSITKNDALVTPRPDPHLLTEGEVTLSAPIDASVQEVPTVESPADFGTASGYWAYRGTDVLIDEEIVRYQALNTQSPFALTQCLRGAYGTKAAAHAAGAKVRHITERYGWYVASPELAEDIGQRLARLIDDVGLDMVCFDGADVTADPETQHFGGHKVALGIHRHVHRDVLIISNGSSHYGWHLMARGGEEDAMARGFQGWVEHRTVHAWGAYHRQNLLPPDFSWVGIFGHTPTMAAARPDDIELVCARSLGYDAAIGWGFAACFGGPSTVAVFERNGRHEELSRLIQTYEKLRIDDYFTADLRRPLQELGTHWRLVPPGGDHDRYRLVPARYLRSPILRPSVPELALWSVRNDLGEQALRVRIEALPALAPYGSPQNVALADFERLAFTPLANASAKLNFEKTGEVHPQAGTVMRLRCDGPGPQANFPARLAGHGQNAWAQLTASYPTPLDLRRHRAVGLWVNGDGQGEVLNVQLQVSPQSYLHFYLPIDFTGWKYCELGEPEGDRVMDYFHYEKFALHELPLDCFNAVTLMLLNPPAGKQVELRLGRIEALQGLGGELVKPDIQVGNQSLHLPVNLLPEQYLETGDPWESRDPGLCRVFDADGNELKRIKLGPSLSLESGPVSLRLHAEGSPTARAKVTLLLEGMADGQKAPPKRSESDR